jgi:riboflavin synthase
MFTGIVTDVGTILAATDHGKGLRRLRVATAYAVEDIALGASIAHNGVCLTVVATGRDAATAWFEVEAAAETLRLTTMGALKPGDRLNLERALKIGDELGGHIVTGHVDGVADVVSREDLKPDASAPWGATAKFTLRVPRPLHRFIARKGSVTLDGVSLTVNEVDDDAFSVMIIPHTLSHTTIGARKAGDRINFEVDLMARYAARLSEAG